MLATHQNFFRSLGDLHSKTFVFASILISFLYDAK